VRIAVFLFAELLVKNSGSYSNHRNRKSLNMPVIIHQIKLGVNSCYLIKNKSALLVDAGVPGKARLFKHKIEKAGIRPEDIKLIILTHSHFDHTGSAKEIQELTGAKIVMHQLERDLSKGGDMIIPHGVNTWGKITQPIFFPIFRRIHFPAFEPDILIDQPEFPLDAYGIEGKIIHTPGHTPGSLSLLLDSGDALVGCMAHDGLPFRLRPGLPIYAENIGQLKESWQILIDKGAKRIYPGHGNPFPIEKIFSQL
jgi:glyoxylase-like metal-dependent hydrolase (beta-lactamase superfamily II)